MTRPTIEEVIETQAVILRYLVSSIDDAKFTESSKLLWEKLRQTENFLAKEQKQEAEIPSEYLVSVNKLQTDLELAKEGLRLALITEKSSGMSSYIAFRNICKKLGVE